MLKKISHFPLRSFQILTDHQKTFTFRVSWDHQKSLSLSLSIWDHPGIMDWKPAQKLGFGLALKGILKLLSFHN